MGNILKDPESKIIIVGLDNAGKSTLVNRMQPGVSTKTPTNF